MAHRDTGADAGGAVLRRSQPRSIAAVLDAIDVGGVPVDALTDIGLVYELVCTLVAASVVLFLIARVVRGAQAIVDAASDLFGSCVALLRVLREARRPSIAASPPQVGARCPDDLTDAQAQGGGTHDLSATIDEAVNQAAGRLARRQARRDLVNLG